MKGNHENCSYFSRQKREKIAKGYKGRERNEPCVKLEKAIEKKGAGEEQNAKGGGEQG